MHLEQKEKLDKYRHLNIMALKGKILFTGSSLMEQFPIHEILMANDVHKIIYNRGIGGFTTDDFLENMEEMVFGVEPSKIFINIGTNDIGSPQYRLERLIDQYREILKRIKDRLPNTKVYIMAYYPVNDVDIIQNKEQAQVMFATWTNKNIIVANEAIEKLALQLDYEYIDVNQGLFNEEGKLKAEFTIDGIHMYADAYQLIFKNLEIYL